MQRFADNLADYRHAVLVRLDNRAGAALRVRTVFACKSLPPKMDISGETIEPAVRDITAQDIAFSYQQRKIIDGISVNIPEKGYRKIWREIKIQGMVKPSGAILNARLIPFDNIRIEPLWRSLKVRRYLSKTL